MRHFVFRNHRYIYQQFFSCIQKQNVIQLLRQWTTTFYRLFLPISTSGSGLVRRGTYQRRSRSSSIQPFEKSGSRRKRHLMSPVHLKRLKLPDVRARRTHRINYLVAFSWNCTVLLCNGRNVKVNEKNLWAASVYVRNTGLFHAYHRTRRGIRRGFVTAR